MRKIANLAAAAIVSLFTTIGIAYALAQIITTPLPFIFAPGQTISSSQVNTNLNTIVNGVNNLQVGGSWIPTDTSGAALAFTSSNATYTQIGNMVFTQMFVQYPVTASGLQAKIGGLPVSFTNASASLSTCTVSIASAVSGEPFVAQPVGGTTNFLVLTTFAQPLANSSLSNSQLYVRCTYPAV